MFHISFCHFSFLTCLVPPCHLSITLPSPFFNFLSFLIFFSSTFFSSDYFLPSHLLHILPFVFFPSNYLANLISFHSPLFHFLNSLMSFFYHTLSLHFSLPFTALNHSTFLLLPFHTSLPASPSSHLPTLLSVVPHFYPTNPVTF